MYNKHSSLKQLMYFSGLRSPSLKRVPREVGNMAVILCCSVALSIFIFKVTIYTLLLADQYTNVRIYTSLWIYPAMDPFTAKHSGLLPCQTCNN